MSPDDKRHGTYAGWQTHIRLNAPTCEPCRDARRSYQRGLDDDHARGLRRRSDPADAKAHVEALISRGMTVNKIAQKAGIHPHTVTMLRAGTWASISTDHADWIMGVTLERDPLGLVPSVGSTRRIQAMARLGWSAATVAQVATALGHDIKADSLKSIRLGRRASVRSYVHDAILAAYGELSMRPAPSGRGTNSLRARAVKAGWPPPLAWDNPDDANERPKGMGNNAADRADLLTDLDVMGLGISEVCRRLSITRDALEKWCARKGMSPTFARLVAREAGMDRWSA